MTIRLRKIFLEYEAKIIKIHERLTKEEEIVDVYLRTLDCEDLLVYAMSFGYLGVVIKRFGCSYKYALNQIDVVNGIEITEFVGNGINIKYGDTDSVKYTPYSIKYKHLKKELTIILYDYIPVHRCIVDIISDYLLMPEPKIEECGVR